MRKVEDIDDHDIVAFRDENSTLWTGRIKDNGDEVPFIKMPSSIADVPLDEMDKVVRVPATHLLVRLKINGVTTVVEFHDDEFVELFFDGTIEAWEYV